MENLTIVSVSIQKFLSLSLIFHRIARPRLAHTDPVTIPWIWASDTPGKPYCSPQISIPFQLSERPSGMWSHRGVTLIRSSKMVVTSTLSGKIPNAAKLTGTPTLDLHVLPVSPGRGGCTLKWW